MDDFDEVVVAMMDDYGTEAIYQKSIQGAYNPETGMSISTTQQSIKAILMDLTLQSNGYSVKWGTMVQAGDKEIYVQPPERIDHHPALVIDPATDAIVVAGVTYKVVTHKTVNPTGAHNIVHTFYVRR